MHLRAKSDAGMIPVLIRNRLTTNQEDGFPPNLCNSDDSELDVALKGRVRAKAGSCHHEWTVAYVTRAADTTDR